MDPNACLTRLLAAIDDGDNAETVQAASDLLVWVLNGGALPQMESQSPFGMLRERLVKSEYIATGLARCADALEDSDNA